MQKLVVQIAMQAGGSTSEVLTYQGKVEVMIIQSAKSGDNKKNKIIGKNPICRYSFFKKMSDYL